MVASDSLLKVSTGQAKQDCDGVSRYRPGGQGVDVFVGAAEGEELGEVEGEAEGEVEGDVEGEGLGDKLGDTEGEELGEVEGEALGVLVGDWLLFVSIETAVKVMSDWSFRLLLDSYKYPPT